MVHQICMLEQSYTCLAAEGGKLDHLILVKSVVNKHY